MSYVSNINISDETFRFDLINKHGNIKTSLVNAIRRTIISDIQVYAISFDNTTFYQNDSILDNEFLKKRLALIPIISNNDLNYDNIVISCTKTNEGELIENVYVSDFVCKDGDTIIDNSNLFQHTNLLFSKLKNDQTISFEAKLEKNSAYHKGSFFCPVAACVYTFQVDNKAVKEITKEMNEEDERKFKTQDIERVYERNDINEPLVYNFSFESIGFYESMEIILLSIDLLISKLELLKDEITDKKSKKIKIQENFDNPDLYDFFIDGESETIGNLLSTYLTYEENIFYAGFLIEHPLKKNILLRIKLIEDNTVDNNIAKIVSVIDKLISIFSQIKKEFEEA